MLVCHPHPLGGGTLRAPTGVAVDPSGALYVSDAGSGSVQRLAAGGQPLPSWGAGLSTPGGLAVDPVGVAYVADTGTSSVVSFSLDGRPRDRFTGAGTDAGPLSGPGALAVDLLGDV